MTNTTMTIVTMATVKMLLPILYIGIISFLTVCIWYYPKYQKTKIGLIPYLLKIFE